jgi:hypothetical protein
MMTSFRDRGQDAVKLMESSATTGTGCVAMACGYAYRTRHFPPVTHDCRCSVPDTAAGVAVFRGPEVGGDDDVSSVCNHLAACAVPRGARTETRPARPPTTRLNDRNIGVVRKRSASIVSEK